MKVWRLRDVKGHAPAIQRVFGSWVMRAWAIVTTLDRQSSAGLLLWRGPDVSVLSDGAAWEQGLLVHFGGRVWQGAPSERA